MTPEQMQFFSDLISAGFVGVVFALGFIGGQQ